MYHRTGLISGILAVVLVLVVYIALGTVDLVFKQDDVEIYRMENVTVFSSLEISDEESNAEVTVTALTLLIFFYAQVGALSHFLDT